MRIPVLCYHRIGGPLELGVTRVPRSVFERQMRAIVARGWRTLTLAEYSAATTAHTPPPTPPQTFLLTFDDGYASLVEDAYPILADLGLTATTFLITDYVGKTNAWDVQYTWRRLPHLSWEQVDQWRRRGFDFASHTTTHRRLTWLDDARAGAELRRSREVLVERLGAEAGRAVAYPFGAVDGRIAGLARTAGYELGFGGVRGNGGDPLHLARVTTYMWDVGDVPFGLRRDSLGALGRFVAHVANRCAVGTTLFKSVWPYSRKAV